MPLNTQDFNTLLANQIAAAQASSSQLLDFSAGSVLLALVQANTSSIALWLQSQNLYILALTRAATSTGADLDSWMNDFSFTRLPATQASGLVTFSRTDASVQAVIPVNAIVQTVNNTVSYTALLDESNPNYNSALNGYVLIVNTTSIDVTVTANVAGTSGNAAAHAISIINTPIPYVDSVDNASSFVNGTDQESDDAFRARFVAYLASLSKATEGAVGYYVSQVHGVIDYSITENETYAGSAQLGFFYVVVDDGTGNASSDLLADVSNAIENVRGLTIAYNVYAPVITNASVVMTVTAATGYDHTEIANLVETAITNYINTLHLGQTLRYSQLIQVAYNASPGVEDVSSYTLNSGTSDITSDAKHVIKLLSITIN